MDFLEFLAEKLVSLICFFFALVFFIAADTAGISSLDSLVMAAIFLFFALFFFTAGVWSWKKETKTEV